MDVIQGRPRSELTEALLLTADIPLDAAYDALVFSGGVSEYVYNTETQEFGDLAVALAAAVRRKMAEHALPAPVQPAAERIRATVIGASQFTVQLSGNTLSISDPSLLPYRNVPVLISRLPEDHEVQPEEVAGLVAEAFERQDLVEGEQQVALAFEWDGLPRYAQIRKIADGIASAVPRSLANGAPLMLVFTGDFAKLVGDTITKDMGIPNPVISIDNLVPAGVRFHRHRGDDLSGARRAGGREVAPLPRGGEADRRGAGLGLVPRRHRPPLKNPAPRFMA